MSTHIAVCFDLIAKLRSLASGGDDALPFAPAAELARLHLRSAITYVLSLPPKQGKAAIASLCATVVSPYFPTVLTEAVARLRGSEIGAARDALERLFVDDLAFGWPDPTHTFHNSGNVLLALEATIELNRPITIPRRTHSVKAAGLLLRAQAA